MRSNSMTHKITINEPVVNYPLHSPGERVRILRLNRRLKVREVAEGSGISRPYVSQIESGFTTLKIDTARKLATFFGVDAEWLLTGKASPLQEAESQWRQAIKASGLDADAEAAIEEITLWIRHLMTGHDSMRKAALAKIQAIAEGFAEQCAKRDRPIRQASLEMARARFSSLSVDIPQNTDTLDLGMNERWEALRSRLEMCVGNDTHSSVAKSISISRQAFHKYLKKKGVPNADTALRILTWVEDKELQQKSGSAGAATPTEAKAQNQNVFNEKTPSPKRK